MIGMMPDKQVETDKELPQKRTSAQKAEESDDSSMSEDVPDDLDMRNSSAEITAGLPNKRMKLSDENLK